MESTQAGEEKKASLLGELLIKRKLITAEQLEEALRVQEKDKELIGQILVKLGYVEERDVVVALIIQCGIPYIAVNKYKIDNEVLSVLPEKLARQFHAVPFDRAGEVLNVVMTDPLNEDIKKELEYATKCKVSAFIATRAEIDEAIDRCYKNKGPKK